ncbi:MAG: hypothetical protein Q8O10_10860 [candidate division Zixibacteria bacterium]|nr:hypothetical protein [candidate division Zixibacteria bacterium]
MRKVVSFISVAFIFLLMVQSTSAKQEKTGRIEKDTLIDAKYGYELRVLSNWKIQLEKEPSLVRSTITKKNYQANKASTMFEEERLIPTIIICADTTSLSLPEIENSLIQGKGTFRNKDEYLMKLDAIASYELIKTKDIALDSIKGKIYGYKKSYLRQVIDPSARYGPEGTTAVTKEDYFLGEVVVLKKGINLYLIQFTDESEYFSTDEDEFSRILQTWKFLK